MRNIAMSVATATNTVVANATFIID